MLSFVNKKFAFMERKMRIGLNYLTDQVEYIFKPDNITRIERVLNGKGTVVDYNYIFKLTGVSQRYISDPTSSEFLSCVAEAHTVIQVTIKFSPHYYVMAPTQKFQKTYGFYDCVVVEKVDGIENVYVVIKDMFESKALLSSKIDSFITNVNTSIKNKTIRFDPISKFLSPDCTKNIVIFRGRVLEGHSDLSDADLKKILKSRLGDDVNIYIIPENTAEMWLPGSSLEECTPQTLLENLERNIEERPKLLSSISRQMEISAGNRQIKSSADSIVDSADICLTVGKTLDGVPPSKLESIYEENMFSSLEYIFLLGFGVIVSSLIILLIYKLKKK